MQPLTWPDREAAVATGFRGPMMLRSIRRLHALAGLAGTLALLALGGCAVAPHQEGTGRVVLSEPDAGDPALQNLAVVRPGVLLRGAQPRADREAGIDGYARLIDQHHVRTIVDLTNTPVDNWIRRLPRDCSAMTPRQRDEIRHVRMPSLEPFPSRAKLVELLRIARDPANQPVYLHCAKGENRTGALVAGYRVVVDGWDPADAKAEATHFNELSIWKSDIDAFVDRVAAERAAIEAELSGGGAGAPLTTDCAP